MNVTAFKCPVPEPVRLTHDAFIGLSPLPRFEIDAAKQRALLRLKSRGCEKNEAYLYLEEMVQTIAVAAGCDADELRAALYVDEVAHLYREWERIQEANLPDAGKLKRELKRLLISDYSTMLDGAWSQQVEEPANFYGKSVAELTDGQIAYFILVKSAYDEIYSSGGKQNRAVSKEWLNRKQN